MKIVTFFQMLEQTVFRFCRQQSGIKHVPVEFLECAVFKTLEIPVAYMRDSAPVSVQT